MALAIALASAAAPSAMAAPLLFTFSGDLVGTFVIDDHPVPVFTTPTSTGILFHNSSGDFFAEDGAEFFLASDNGGFETGPFGLVNAFGPQLFSGTLDNPVFAPGSYTVESFNGKATADLVISPGAPVPELAAGWLAAAAAAAALFVTRLRPRCRTA